MGPRSDIDDSFRLLLISALDGDATSAELKELNELLLKYPELRKSAARFVGDDSYLSGAIKSIDQTAKFFEELQAEATKDDTAAHASLNLAGQTAPDCPESAEAGFQQREYGPRALVLSTLRTINRNGVVVAATAAVVMIAFAWQYVAIKSEFERLQTIAARPDQIDQGEGRNGSRGNTRDSVASTAARVTGLVNCDWPEGVAPLKFGDPLAPGQRLNLEKGLMQLTFGTGAKVVIEGPTDFTVMTPSQATLERGKVAAAVPRFARGYTILTPTAEIVDLGTEFGVDVDTAGRSEVHVFEGDVVARSRTGGASQPKLIQAQQDEAVDFRGLNEGARRIPADQSKFVRRLIAGVAADKLPPLPVTDQLVLWLAADLILESNEHAPVSTWSDTLIGDNRFSDDAWQFDERLCPTWVRDQHGRPAVRFDGWSNYLATSPMATGNKLTTFVVFAPSPVSFASDFHGGMLVRFGSDVPSLEFSLMPDRAPKARVWSRGDDGTKSYVGELRGTVVEPQVISAAAYCYDTEKNRAELLVNGNSAGVTSAPRRLEQHARKYIGAHAEPWWQAYFSGNIYEIIVYDAALSSADRDLVFGYLSRRYGISLEK